MNTEIISIGTEVLCGDVLNTNAQKISKICADNGHNVNYSTVVGDDFEKAKEVIEIARNRSDLIIITGGLGPTSDDITRDVVSSVFGLKLVEDEFIKKHIEEYFKDTVIPTICYKEALKPEGSEVLMNHHGTACGYKINLEDRVILVLPGPPDECIPILNSTIKSISFEKTKHYSKFVKFINVDEALACELCEEVIKDTGNPIVASYCSFKEAKFKITAISTSQAEADKIIDPIINYINIKLDKNIYAYNDEDEIEDAIVKLLRKNNFKISTAESCTGGMIASKIINVKGASDIIDEAYVTYSIDAKCKLLDIPESDIYEFGVYSYFTAKLMLDGLMNKSKADCCISITGVADIQDKEAGTIYVGTSVQDKCKIKMYKLNGNSRNENRVMASKLALIQLYNQLIDTEGIK